MRIAAIQMNSQENKEKNIDKAEEMIDEAVSKGSKIVVLPEMFNFLGAEEQQPANAEKIPGLTIKRLMKKAKSHGVYILCGSILEARQAGERLFNTSVLVDPKGEIIAKYSKLHLFDVSMQGEVVYQESAIVQPGSEIITIETEFGHLGLSICYDLRFPEFYRRLTVRGARLIFIPAAFTLHTGKDHWERLIRARAIENQVYVVAANQIGSYAPQGMNWGKSMVVDPWGIVLSKAPDKESVIFADIDYSYQQEIREKLPSLRHRREDIFVL